MPQPTTTDRDSGGLLEQVACYRALALAFLPQCPAEEPALTSLR